MALTATIELENTKDFNILKPIAELVVKIDEDLDKFIAIANSDLTFEEKYNIVSSERKFSKYEIKAA